MGHVIPSPSTHPMANVNSSPVPTPQHHTPNSRHATTSSPYTSTPKYGGMASPGATTVPVQNLVAQPQVVSPEVLNGNGTRGQQPSPSYQGAIKPAQFQRAFETTHSAVNVSRQTNRPPTSVNNMAVPPSSQHHSPHNQGPGTSPTMQPENKRPRLNGPDITGVPGSTTNPYVAGNNYARVQSSSSSRAPAQASRPEQGAPGATRMQSGSSQVVDILPMINHYSSILAAFVKEREPIENTLSDDEKVCATKGRNVISSIL